MKTVVLAGMLLLTIVGCSSKPAANTSQASPSQATTTQASDGSAKSVTSQNGVQLLDAGAEPRQPLRLKPTIGKKQQIAMTMKQDIALSLPGKPAQKVTTPAIVMTMETTVKQVEPNGDIQSAFRYVDFDVNASSSTPPQMVEAMRSQLRKMNGLSGTIVTDARGQTKSMQFDSLDKLDPALKQTLQQTSQSLSQISTPLPEEPIGIGAKWRVNQAPTVNGIHLNQTGTFELASLTNDIANLNVALEQQANQQTIQFPGAAGKSILLKSLTAKGSGTSQLNLTNIMAPRASMAIRSTGTMGIPDTQTAKEVEVGMESAVQIELEPK